MDTLAERKQKGAFTTFHRTFDLDKFCSYGTEAKYITLFEKLSELLYEKKITKEEIKKSKINESYGHSRKNHESLNKLIEKTKNTN